MKKTYLDPSFDLFNREVLSFSISKQPSTQTIISALNQAIETSSDKPFRRTPHFDQSWAYYKHTNIQTN